MATESNLQAELETLKADVSKLRGDVGQLLDLLKAMGLEKLDGAKETLDEELEKRREEFREAVAGARAKGERTARAVEGEITDHPLGSVMTAFGLGFIIAKLLDVGRHN